MSHYEQESSVNLLDERITGDKGPRSLLESGDLTAKHYDINKNIENDMSLLDVVVTGGNW